MSSWSVEVDPGARLVVLTVRDGLTDAEAAGLREAIAHAPGFHPSYGFIGDFRGCGPGTVRAALVRQRAREPLYFSPTSRLALVADSEAVFGMARMFNLAAESERIAIFKDFDEARRWVMGEDGS